MQEQIEFCFGTLALGANYRNLASELAKDLEKYSPSTSLVILTDKPEHFRKFINVIAFKHRQESVGCYHDKRHVIAKGLTLFNSCIFIDADMRILASIPNDLQWKPGITAKIAWHNIVKHNKNQVEIKILHNIAQKLNLKLEDITFVHECLFAVTKDSGREIDFLKTWQKVANYCELNKMYRGEGHAIGLAAAQAGMKIRIDSMSQINFFKDKLELPKVKSGNAENNQINAYLEKQQSLEYPQKSFLTRLINKLDKSIMYLYRSSRLKFLTMKDIKFYYM